jgi:hypothetical protein
MQNFLSEKTAFAGGIVLLLALALSGDAQTGQVFFQTTTFGMVGLARNQVARLNVLTLVMPTAIEIRCVRRSSAEMKFLDDQGRELKSSNVPVDWD